MVLLPLPILTKMNANAIFHAHQAPQSNASLPQSRIVPHPLSYPVKTPFSAAPQKSWLLLNVSASSSCCFICPAEKVYGHAVVLVWKWFHSLDVCQIFPGFMELDAFCFFPDHVFRSNRVLVGSTSSRYDTPCCSCLRRSL